ncbi:MAG: 4-hydroxy-tetrahydrodipicolinate synthase [Bacteroidales bacterium]|nr:4-hydroxy-tetrahydrodipicolinate synthase [Bacteroidales bacterium]
MKELLLKGCGTALFTPFTKEGGVDEDAFAASVRRQVDAGIDFLVPLGTTGETPCLSDEEKLRVLSVAKENAAGRPVVAGVGTNSVAGTLANMQLLESADAFLVVVPYYNKPPQRGIYQYFKTIAGVTPKPVIVYNVPGRTGSNISAETTLALAADVDNIIGIKEASGNFAQIESILAAAPKDFAVLSGNDGDTLSLMQKGAAGVISVASNVAPSLMAELTGALLRGDDAAAEAIDTCLQPLYDALFVESNPIPGKAAMHILGLMENTLRLPLVPAEDKTVELLKDVLQKLHL